MEHWSSTVFILDNNTFAICFSYFSYQECKSSFSKMNKGYSRKVFETIHSHHNVSELTFLPSITILIEILNFHDFVLFYVVYILYSNIRSG